MWRLANTKATKQLINMEIPIATLEKVPTANSVCPSAAIAGGPLCRTLSKHAVTTMEHANANPQNPAMPNASVDASPLPFSKAVIAS